MSLFERQPNKKKTGSTGTTRPHAAPVARIKLDVAFEDEKKKPRSTRRAQPATRKAEPSRLEMDSAMPSAVRPRSAPARRKTQSSNQFGWLITGFKTGRIPLIAALTVVAGIAFWLFTSGTFSVDRVEIKGSRLLRSAEVLKLPGVDKTNIFFFKEADLVQQLERLPYVQSAQVSKNFPDQIIITINERQSAVNWKIGNVNFLVDRDGVVLDSVVDKDLTTEAKTFPVIQSLEERRLKPGDRVDIMAVRSIQTIQEQLVQAGVKLSAVQYSPNLGLLVISSPENGNWKAVLGTDAQLSQKISLLKGLLADKKVKWSYADLRFVNRPAVS